MPASRTFFVPFPTLWWARLAAPDGPLHWRRLLEPLMLILLAVQLARLAWLALPAAPIGEAEAASIAPAGALPRMEVFYRAAAAAATGAHDSSGYQLRGVRVDALGGSAILAGPDGKQQSYPVGASVVPGLVLHAVGAGYAVLRGPQGLQRLELPVTAPAAGERAAALPAAEVPDAAAPAGPAAVLAQAGLAMDQAGRWTVNPRGDAALLLAAGLRGGDIIEQVNGQQLTAEHAEALARELPPGAPVTLTLLRDGQRQTVTLPAGPQ